jgi:uncharacterized membrane protein YgcG
VDEHVIAPRRTLPPVPPAQRPAPGTTLAPPAPASADETSWYDPQDLLADSLVHPDLVHADLGHADLGRTDVGPLAHGSASQAAHDLVRESGRMLVLDEQLLAALDAAAKAAEARRALTAGLVPAALMAPAAPPLTAEHDADDLGDDLDDEFEDDELEDALADDDHGDLPGAVVGLDPSTVDVAAEFARHDDLVETRRHPSVDDQPLTGATALVTDTGRHHLALPDDLDEPRDEPGDDDVPTLGALSHRTVVTRGSSRRWIPVGVGAGVLSIVAAVLLTSGFGADRAAPGTDEAARTGAVTTEAPTPSPTPSLPAPAMNTLDLSGPVATGSSTRVDDDATAQPSTTSRTGSAVQPQVATPPVAPNPVTTGNGNTGSGTPSEQTASPTATVVTPSDSSGSSNSGSSNSGSSNSGSGTSGSGSGGSDSGGSDSGSGTPETHTQDPGGATGSSPATQG